MPKDLGLLFGYGPVLLFDGFGEPGEFEVGVGVAGAVEDVLEPGAPGDAVGVKPVALELHHAVVEGRGKLRVDGTGGEFAGDGLIEFRSGGFEGVNGLRYFAEIERGGWVGGNGIVKTP